ncbi:pyruvate kinase [Streptomyces alkaliterrae]|uniref:Pyruvate kinase n=1 Tax=Streptomyces alkaliterrae TaxID=2213162 RepID=A0A5P0YM57_9ACTN|nr:pyruvate kinase [Streptomyces alkaliterrae]MBB1253350.1 pyruvate kinase [Streptomyces alkaliterrae]MBB1259222.1 pyruvate kinase [Streptomyces alkaliterrae]MQS01395.1 pyruvate kinase [Streptomyces alkaliterrae]
MRRAKIVCTLGPATDTYEQIEELVRAGADVARLNLAHGTHGEHETRLHHLRTAARQADRRVGTLVDLQGPKVQLGTFRQGPAVLEADDEFTVSTRDVPGDHTCCATTHPALHRDVRPGHRLLVEHDGPVLEVTEVRGPDVRTRVLAGGIVSDHKVLHLPDTDTTLPVLTKKDEDDLRWALRNDVDLVALPHTRSADDVLPLRRVMAEEDVRRPVLAKLEKPQSVEQLRAVLDAFDGLLIARGDLGVELPLQTIPAVQKHAVKLANRNAKPVIVATQMLDSMVESPRPTRAEVSDIANAVIDGADALMLSAETSVGKYPTAAVATMSRIVAATERDLLARGLQPLVPASKPRTRGGAVARAAAELGDFLGARYLVAFTQSGDTARRLARSRSPIPLLAFTPDPATHGQLNLTWGVETILGPHVETTDEMVRQVEEQLLKLGRCVPGDVVIITAGSPPGVPGTTNLVRVHRIGEGGGDR